MKNTNLLLKLQVKNYLFEPNGICLWITIFTQVELLVQVLGQIAMTSLTKYGHFCMKFHASLKCWLWLNAHTIINSHIDLIFSKQSLQWMYNRELREFSIRSWVRILTSMTTQPYMYLSIFNLTNPRFPYIKIFLLHRPFLSNTSKLLLW